MKKVNYNIGKIAGNIKKGRTKMGMSRDELAKKAKVNYNTIIKLESGANKNPTVQTLVSLSKVLGVNVEWFLL
ncbi:helix-turn-helix transcriptional regulator [Candidatus Uhrbacteria bacterium]|nr:helix-turn-helix transcriptional regulator [Candidatus Uhrbacteria bacterium]